MGAQGSIHSSQRPGTEQDLDAAFFIIRTEQYIDTLGSGAGSQVRIHV
jgi:hypothetical protein